MRPRWLPDGSVFLLTCSKAPNLFCKCISKDRPRNFFRLSGVTNFQSPLNIASGHPSFHAMHRSGYCPCRFSAKSLTSSHLHQGNAASQLLYLTVQEADQSMTPTVPVPLTLGETPSFPCSPRLGWTHFSSRAPSRSRPPTCHKWLAQPVPVTVLLDRTDARSPKQYICTSCWPSPHRRRIDCVNAQIPVCAP